MTTLYPQVDYKKWAKRYNLGTEGRPCSKCGKFFEPTIPVATEDFRGLKAVEHECGPQYVLKRMKFADPKEREQWMETVIGLIGDFREEVYRDDE